MRYEFRRDADAGIADAELNLRVDALDFNPDESILRRESNGIGKQIPDDLLQSLGIAENGSGPRIENGLKADLLCQCGRLHCFDGGGYDGSQVDNLEFNTQPSGNDP